MEIKPTAELEIKEKPLYTVRVTHVSLRHRSTPEIANNIIGIITNRGIYQIYEERDGWGRLEDGSWIMLKYTEKYNEF